MAEHLLPDYVTEGPDVLLVCAEICVNFDKTLPVCFNVCLINPEKIGV